MTTFTREDFEMAAKAAGLDIWTGGNHLDECGGYPIGLDSDGGYQAIWNPRDDDGDALRLAVRLNLTLGLDHEFGIPHVNGVSFLREADMEKATRHAIFRAAIAIGRAMP